MSRENGKKLYPFHRAVGIFFRSVLKECNLGDSRKTESAMLSLLPVLVVLSTTIVPIESIDVLVRQLNGFLSIEDKAEGTIKTEIIRLIKEAIYDLANRKEAIEN